MSLTFTQNGKFGVDFSRDLRNQQSNLNNLQNVQLRVNSCYTTSSFDMKVMQTENRIKRGPFSKEKELIEGSILIIAIIK